MCCERSTKSYVERGMLATIKIYVHSDLRGVNSEILILKSKPRQEAASDIYVINFHPIFYFG